MNGAALVEEEEEEELLDAHGNVMHEGAAQDQLANIRPEQLAEIVAHINWDEFPMPNVRGAMFWFLVWVFFWFLDWFSFTFFLFFFFEALLILQPDDLENLLSMGFPKWRCQKALLLNGYDYHSFLHWSFQSYS
jgi:hypothetical protein